MDHRGRHLDMPKYLENCYILTCNVNLQYGKTKVKSTKNNLTKISFSSTFKINQRNISISNLIKNQNNFKNTNNIFKNLYKQNFSGCGSEYECPSNENTEDKDID